MGRPKHKKQTIPTCLRDRLPNDADVERVEQYFNVPAYKYIRKLLIEELTDRRERSVQKSDSPEKFAYPAWSEYQANEVGYRRALKEIINLLER